MERGGAAAAAAAAAEAAEAAVMVKREVIVARVTCPLCKRLLRDATTISECLHTCECPPRARAEPPPLLSPSPLLLDPNLVFFFSERFSRSVFVLF